MKAGINVAVATPATCRPIWGKKAGGATSGTSKKRPVRQNNTTCGLDSTLSCKLYAKSAQFICQEIMAARCTENPRCPIGKGKCGHFWTALRQISEVRAIVGFLVASN